MFCQACGTNVADGVAFCTSCGRPIVGYAIGQSGGAAAMAMPAAIAQAGTTQYAGFWLRFAAAILDGIILAIPSWIISLVLFGRPCPS
jgi:hypothetical protein